MTVQECPMRRGSVLLALGAVCAVIGIVFLLAPYSGVAERSPREGIDPDVVPPGLPVTVLRAECDPAIAQVLGLTEVGAADVELIDPSEVGPDSVSTVANQRPYCRTVGRYRVGLALVLGCLSAVLVGIGLRARRAHGNVRSADSGMRRGGSDDDGS